MRRQMNSMDTIKRSIAVGVISAVVKENQKECG